MTIMNRTIRYGLASLGLALMSQAMAQPQKSPATPTGGCIELKTIAEREQTVTAADGHQVKQLTAPGKVVPGDEIVWTTTARNLCDKSADKVVINQPVPEHMNFVADSALGGNAQITYSVDGKEFTAATALTVRAADGKTRPARADEVRQLRWTLVSAIAPQDTALVRFRATVQ
jgi:uncharacterized repeat protein (TIGR01451 family)